MSYRYIGNKGRLLGLLTTLVSERIGPKAVVADLMCGTASFAAAMRDAGYRVVAADIMTFAYLHARVRLTLGRKPTFVRLRRSYTSLLSELNELRPLKGMFYREYSPAGHPREGCAPRMYFSPENAALIDAVMRTIRTWRADGSLPDNEYALLRHDLVLATNRVANIAGTYGHFRSKWSPSALGRLELRPSTFSPYASSQHKAVQGPAEYLAPNIKADLCYLDPPYTKRQYAANYHIPETLARCDSPPAVGVSGLRPWRDQYSDFCSKIRVRESFRTIILSMDCPRFLISYSEDGLLSRIELVELLEEFGRVQVIEATTSRFRSNSSALPRDLTEYVFDLHRG
jgi:adenine-specific DNA-methyltransferase